MIFFMLYLLIIKEISSNDICSERCSSCVGNPEHEYDEVYDNCETCADGLYLLDGTVNCYYDYEVPGTYLDSYDHKFKECSSEYNCYECNSPTNCISCLRGSKYVESSNSCEPCDTNYYIYVLESSENCQMKDQSEWICDLKITNCSNIPTTNNDYECPIDYPLLLTGDTGEKECTMEAYNPDNHIISNEIIKTQWLNKRIQIGINNCMYLGVCLSSENDLIFETNTIYEVDDNNRYFYGIKSNGRPFFNVADNGSINIYIFLFIFIKK